MQFMSRPRESRLGLFDRNRVFLKLCVLQALCCISLMTAAYGSPVDDVQQLMPLWKANAPLCEGAPSSANCNDGDMTLFNALLCVAGEKIGCDSVAGAQDASGRWHRSPRFKKDPGLHPTDSFSWDMALGVQLYVAKTGDKVSLERWLAWVEQSRPCLVESPKIDGMTYCLVRGWPRWCTDDTEKGCTARPQDLATLAVTTDALKVRVPPPAEDKLPGGAADLILIPLIAASREANAAFSLKRLLELTSGLQPTIVLIDAAGNRPGYSRHLVAVNLMLMRLLGQGSATVDRAAEVLASLQPDNPYFQYVANVDKTKVANMILKVAPKSLDTLPAKKDDWAWQRDTSEQAWLKSNLWDFLFIGRMLAQ